MSKQQAAAYALAKHTQATNSMCRNAEYACDLFTEHVSYTARLSSKSFVYMAPCMDPDHDCLHPQGCDGSAAALSRLPSLAQTASLHSAPTQEEQIDSASSARPSVSPAAAAASAANEQHAPAVTGVTTSINGDVSQADHTSL